MGEFTLWTLDEGISRLKESGTKITAQRIAILKRLEGRKDHPSAEQIYQELKRDFPTISFATIYSTALLLAEKKLIQILTVDDKRVNYDPDPEPHGHFRCTACGHIEDIPITESLVETLKMGQDSSVSSVQLYMYGLCPSCNVR